MSNIKVEEPTVDSVFEKICEMDKEFESKMKNPNTKDEYFANEVPKKCTRIDGEVEKLSIDDKRKLAEKIEGLIPTEEGQYATTIVATFRECVKLLIHRYEYNQREAAAASVRVGDPFCKVLKGLG